METGKNHFNCSKKLFELEFFKILPNYNSNETLEWVIKKAMQPFLEKRHFVGSNPNGFLPTYRQEMTQKMKSIPRLGMARER